MMSTAREMPDVGQLTALLDQAELLAQRATGIRNPLEPLEPISPVPAQLPPEDDHMGPSPYATCNTGATFPDFKVANPEAWFRQLEMFFQFSRIRADHTMYFNVLSRLPEEVYNRVTSDLDAAPKGNSYPFIKKLLCKLYSKSATQKATQILNLWQLGNSHPTVLLNEVRKLIPASHQEHECSQCGHVEKLPPCPIAYTQYQHRLPPAIARELNPEPTSWHEVSKEVEESWEAHTSLGHPVPVQAVKSEPVQPNKDFTPAPAPTQEPQEFAQASAVNQRSLKVEPTPLVCQWHAIYGKMKCQVGCAFQKKASQAPVPNPGKGKKPGSGKKQQK